MDVLYKNTFFIAIIFSAIIGRVMQDSKNNIYKMWTVFFVGTFFHELAHFTVGLLTLAMPYKFSVFPKRVEKDKPQYVMGHVNFLFLNWFNVFWTSMAPLLLLPLSYLVYKDFFIVFDYTVVNFFIWLYLIISMVFSSIPSSVDFRGLVQGNIILNLLGGLVVFFIAYFLNYIGVFKWVYSTILTAI